jgi:Ca2+-binding EF-hand superfamily protein
MDGSAEELASAVVEMLKELGKREGVALAAMFEAIDFDGNGTINRAEFTQVLTELGFSHLTETEVLEVLDHFDKDGNGEVDWKEFVAMVEGADKLDATTEARAALRAYMLAEVFKVEHGSDVKEEQLKAVFEAFDKDQDGTIEIEEFRQAATALGFTPSSEELELAVKVFDFNGDGSVSYLEFIQFVKGDEVVTAEARAALRAYMLAEVFKVEHGSDVKEEQLKAVFGAFDKNQDGTIEIEEFRQAATALGFTPSSEELELAVKVFDFNGDGSVSYLEFVQFVRVGETAQTKGGGKIGASRRPSVMDAISKFKGLLFLGAKKKKSPKGTGSVVEKAENTVDENALTSAEAKNGAVDPAVGGQRRTRAKAGTKIRTRRSVYEGEPDKEGWLERHTSGPRKTWLKRYHVLRAHYLVSFETDEKTEEKDMVDLHDLQVRYLDV